MVKSVSPIHSCTFVAADVLLCARDHVSALDDVEEPTLVWLVDCHTPVMEHKHSALLLLSRCATR